MFLYMVTYKSAYYMATATCLSGSACDKPDPRSLLRAPRTTTTLNVVEFLIYANFLNKVV